MNAQGRRVLQHVILVESLLRSIASRCEPSDRVLTRAWEHVMARDSEYKPNPKVNLHLLTDGKINAAVAALRGVTTYVEQLQDLVPSLCSVEMSLR